MPKAFLKITFTYLKRNMNKNKTIGNIAKGAYENLD
jgi:hypothetical protein